MFLKIDTCLIKNFASANKITTENLKVFYMLSNSDGPQLAIQITKKALKLAVIRNKVRRVIREDFRKISVNLPAIDILLVISKKIYSNKHEISDILMQEWKVSIKSLLVSQ